MNGATSTNSVHVWIGTALVWVGAIGAAGVIPQKAPQLQAPLSEAVPNVMAAYQGKDLDVSEAEQRVAGFTNYLMRSYAPAHELEAGSETDVGGVTAATLPWYTVYVGYYDGQTQGSTIHSPKNCLPGSGWEALESRYSDIQTPTGSVTVNRYLLQKGNERALVLYWYQGRGRVQANEYVVKWDLLRDAALRQRSDEALVRIVVPILDSEETAFKLAESVARELVPGLDTALPG